MGEKIKEYIARAGLKQSSICEKIGMPASTFSDILNGKRKIVVEEYFNICDALGVPVDTFRPRAN